MERSRAQMPLSTCSYVGGQGGAFDVHAGEPRPLLHVDEGVSFDINAAEFATDEFRMYHFKVDRCPKQRPHDWTQCPFSHAGERATRRDPRARNYSGVACAEFRRTGACARGDDCTFAHGVFESWLHPSKYKTQMCSDIKSCKRTVCFFAHSPEELRAPTPSAGTAAAIGTDVTSQPDVVASSSSSDVAAIAVAVEKLLGNKAPLAGSAVRHPGLQSFHVPPPPPPPPPQNAALSSFLRSAAVLQQSLPGSDIMNLLHSALGSASEAECYSGMSTPHSQQPPLPPPISTRHSAGGSRQASMHSCMYGGVPRSQPAGHHGFSQAGRSSWSGAPYAIDADALCDGRAPLPVPRMKSFSCTGSGAPGSTDLCVRPPPPLSVASGPADESVYGAHPMSARSGSLSGSLSARAPPWPQHSTRNKSITPPNRSPLTVDDATPHGWSQHVLGDFGSQRDGSGSGVSDMSTAPAPPQEYTLWGGQTSLWGCDAADSRPTSCSQQLGSDSSPTGGDAADQHFAQECDSAPDPLLSKLPADLLNAFASGHGAGKLADVTNQLAAMR